MTRTAFYDKGAWHLGLSVFVDEAEVEVLVGIGPFVVGFRKGRR